MILCLEFTERPADVVRCTCASYILSDGTIKPRDEPNSGDPLHCSSLQHLMFIKLLHNLASSRDSAYIDGHLGTVRIIQTNCTFQLFQKIKKNLDGCFVTC